MTTWQANNAADASLHWVLSGVLMTRHERDLLSDLAELYRAHLLRLLDQELILNRWSSSCSCCCWSDALQNNPKAPTFRIGSGLNLGGLLLKYIRNDGWSRISDMTSYFQGGDHGVMSAGGRCSVSCICSSVRRALTSPPRACDIIGSLYVLQLLIRGTFELVTLYVALTRNGTQKFSPAILEFCFAHNRDRCQVLRVQCWVFFFYHRRAL